MEELFNMLSSSARLDKSKREKKKRSRTAGAAAFVAGQSGNKNVTGAVPLWMKNPCEQDDGDDEPKKNEHTQQQRSRDRTGKRDTSEAKMQQVHKEQVAAFRRSMSIRISNNHNKLSNDYDIFNNNNNNNDDDVPDPISSFQDLKAPSWWTTNSTTFSSTATAAAGTNSNSSSNNSSFTAIQRAIQRNIEAGRWKEPTPIQMQAIPALLERRDLIGAAPTGSGKSGAFILPALFLSAAPHCVFFGITTINDNSSNNTNPKKSSNKKTKKKERNISRQGEIRTLLIAPSLELAAQIHREVERLGTGKPGGLSSLLLSKSNAAHVISGTAGGKHGLDVLVSTPLRLVDAIETGGLRLNSIRLVVLDEADRLLDAADGERDKMKKKKKDMKKAPTTAAAENSKANPNDADSEEEDEVVPMSSGANSAGAGVGASGSMQTRTFLAQMDVILSQVPVSAVRALFSATVTPTVHALSESILRNPVDVAIATSSLGGVGGGANPDIAQELTFVGKEEGKLLAIRQLVQRGQLKPPAIVFLQSQERAQALFEELLYDNIHVDVIHAGRSRSARENAVSRFRRGETWVLICTDLVARGVDFRAVNMVINYDLPTSGISYIHRIGRCGRAGRKGRAITLFTEADFDQLRTIANVMRQSGCQVEEWMLNLKKGRKDQQVHRPRHDIDTTPIYDVRKKRKHIQMIQDSKKKKKQRAGPAKQTTGDRNDAAASAKKDAPK
jgi:ATP-dependent RNA helicase DDX52/ROK1